MSWGDFGVAGYEKSLNNLTYKMESWCLPSLLERPLGRSAPCPLSRADKFSSSTLREVCGRWIAWS
jgi:hypothetical protein